MKNGGSGANQYPQKNRRKEKELRKPEVKQIVTVYK